MGSPNPLLRDPTRSISLRRSFIGGLTKAFSRIKKAIFHLIVTEDAFGLNKTQFTTNQQYDACNTHLDVTDPEMLSIWKGVQNSLIPTDILKKETEPHITIRYGLFDIPGMVDNVQSLVSGFGKVKVRVKGLSLFQVNSVKYGPSDVIKFDVESQDLLALNNRLGLLPNKQDFEYSPHMTIAYVPRGEGQKYIDINNGLVGIEMSFDSLVFSDSNKVQTKISLVDGLTINRRWAYQSQDEAVSNFDKWLDERIKREVTSPTEAERWRKYIQRGFEKGVNRGYADTRQFRKRGEKVGVQATDFDEGDREKFVRMTLSRSVASEKLRLLKIRSLAEVDGMTSDMKNKARQVLTDGLVRGQSPREIATRLTKTIDTSLARAMTIARTELVRAHADGQLEAMEQLGIKEVGIAVEWSTRHNPCPLCAPMQGVVLRITEAKGMIPRHPNCYCAWAVANVGEGKVGQKRTQKQVKSAIKKSQKEEGDSDWKPNIGITKSRPESPISKPSITKNQEIDHTNCMCHAEELRSFSSLLGRIMGSTND